eukprot:CAMPEP_0113933650 /NCGR_PEP_ID=MMETSP1339-20121228/883_1 /TAXON_ID=94617 /ORGANISM="Fibrocapsa japonica" /LENGTH=209 /DNA_ID=CAMNT_0000935045 /DNA_START=75 /DNA_END=704 /DNA_ORIENTATION=+ /assembly_acc=CAM_ASM_000762
MRHIFFLLATLCGILCSQNSLALVPLKNTGIGHINRLSLQSLDLTTRLQATEEDVADDLEEILPPDPTPYQTTQQRRRSRIIPISQRLKKKPRKRDRKIETNNTEEGELVPLVPGANRKSGIEYYMQLEREAERMEAEKAKERAAREAAARRPPSEDQMPVEKLKAEIVNPYKQNYIGVAIVIFAAFGIFFALNPSLLDSTPKIEFPDL